MLKILQFGNLRRVGFVLNGGIAGGKRVINSGGKVLGLNGKTLIFTTPAGTVTFSDTGGTGLSMADIIAEIVGTGGLSGLKPGFSDGYLNVIETTPTNGVVLAGTGTANAAFGFGKSTVTGLVYDPPGGSAPRMVGGIQVRAQLDGYYVLVEPA